jgi:hypothetical protein
VSVGTGTYVSTRAQTAVHLTDAIMGTFEQILAHLGLGSSYLRSNWTTIERGLKTWIAEGTLKWVRLECGSASNPAAVFEIPLSYRITGNGDVEFVVNHTRMARIMAKLSSVPAGTSYRVVVEYTGTPSHVDGWGSTEGADISKLSAYRLGGVAAGPYASASLTAYGR